MRAGLKTDGYKADVRDYLMAATSLFRSMQTSGYDDGAPVPIDIDGELLNGSHRVACAIALGIEQVPVVRMEQRAWAPPWDAAWFRANGADPVCVAELSARMSWMMNGYCR